VAQEILNLLIVPSRLDFTSRKWAKLLTAKKEGVHGIRSIVSVNIQLHVHKRGFISYRVKLKKAQGFATTKSDFNSVLCALNLTFINRPYVV
jgi:hypothetical protein